MNKYFVNNKLLFLQGSIVLAMLLGLFAFVNQIARAAGSYYIDCSAASNGNGTQASPWNNLTTVSNMTFNGSDQILFKRGTTCSGQLWPKGSGSAATPITIDSYGSGALPIINGGTGNNAAVRLYNQQGWHIQNIEVTGGDTYWLFVRGKSRTLQHFFVAHCLVHDRDGPGLSKKKWPGQIETDAGRPPP